MESAHTPALHTYIDFPPIDHIILWHPVCAFYAGGSLPALHRSHLHGGVSLSSSVHGGIDTCYVAW
jgi:hypothetical protein